MTFRRDGEGPGRAGAPNDEVGPSLAWNRLPAKDEGLSWKPIRRDPGRIAQLARALLSHSRGHRFESCYAHSIRLQPVAGSRIESHQPITIRGFGRPRGFMRFDAGERCAPRAPDSTPRCEPPANTRQLIDGASSSTREMVSRVTKKRISTVGCDRACGVTLGFWFLLREAAESGHRDDGDGDKYPPSPEKSGVSSPARAPNTSEPAGCIGAVSPRGAIE
jgi:hypothetical protein